MLPDKEKIKATKRLLQKHPGGISFLLCALLYEKNRLISYGFNTCKTHPLPQKIIDRDSPTRYDNDDRECCPTIHAEFRAILNRRGDKGDTIYVARMDSHGNIKIAKPCAVCQEIMKMFDIKVAYYSDNDGKFRRMILA